MFQIITTRGELLDLKPDWEIEIDIESPIFAADTIPVTFSTSILLPPSRNNCSLLGYLAALKMPPSVKTLGVKLLMSQQVLFVGRLEYEGITEDGDLEYTFTEKSTSRSFDGKLADIINSLPKYYPVLLKEDATGISIYNENEDRIDADAKFCNYSQNEIPAVRVSVILSALGITNASRYINLFNNIAVLVGKTDMTASEFLQNLCKMFCCRITRSLTGLTLISVDEALEDDRYDDYQAKVSDIFSAKNQKPQGYVFKYTNDRLGRIAHDDSFDHLDDVRRYYIANSINEYRTVLYHLLGDPYYINPQYAEIISIKSHVVQIKYSGYTKSVIEFLADIVGHFQEETINTNIDGEQFDSSTGFKLPECVPVCTMDPTISSGTLFPQQRYIIAPRVPSSGIEGVYIGRLIAPSGGETRYQLVDKIFYGQGGKYKEDATSLDSLTVYNSFHKTFAEWLESAHQIIEADVLMSPNEINTLQLDKKFAFAHKLWFIKKLSVNLNTSSEMLSVHGEFIDI